jgi:hypothetical protein
LLAGLKSQAIAVGAQTQFREEILSQEQAEALQALLGGKGNFTPRQFTSAKHSQDLIGTEGRDG